jgi:kynurenine formamidase
MTGDSYFYLWWLLRPVSTSPFGRQCGVTMERRIIDLSVPIGPTSPGSMLGVDIQYIDHREGATIFGAALGLREDDFPDGMFSAVEKVTLTTHSGTHLDAPWHYGPFSEGKPARTVDLVPLEWCFGSGVRLDFRHKKAGELIGVEDLQESLGVLGYEIRPFDIILLMTGASDKYFGTAEYVDSHPGVSREATLWLIAQGVKVMGIDAWGWDRPFKSVVQEVRRGDKERLWESHFAGKVSEYCHIENLTNLSSIPISTGFDVAVFPVKIERAGGGWVRAVAIV